MCGVYKEIIVNYMEENVQFWMRSWKEMVALMTFIRNSVGLFQWVREEWLKKVRRDKGLEGVKHGLAGGYGG